MAEYTDDDVKRNAEPGRAVSHAFDCTHDPCRCDAWPEFVDDVTRLVEMMKATGWQANSPGEPTVEEQALALADEVLSLRARLRAQDDEIDRLRAVNAALAAAIFDIFSELLATEGIDVADCPGTDQCTDMSGWTCYQHDPDDPGEWCPVCVAEVAWCAWKMGVLGA